MAGYIKGRNKGRDTHKHDWKQVGTKTVCTQCGQHSNHAKIGHNTPLEEEEDRLKVVRRLTS